MTLAGVELDTTQAFTVLSIFNALQFTISTLPQPSVAAADCGPGLSLLLRNSSYSWRVKEEGKEEEGDKILRHLHSQRRETAGNRQKYVVPCYRNVSF